MNRRFTSKSRRTGKQQWFPLALVLATLLAVATALIAVGACTPTLPANAGKSGKTATYSETMLNVGQGLSILIDANDNYAIYDGGGRDASSYVVAYLKKHDVTTLKYMLISHYDEDHIAGLIGILNTAKVENIVCPDYKSDTKICNSLFNAMAKSGANIIHPKVGDQFKIGGATILVIGPQNYTSDIENNRSVAVKITYGKFSSVITGDAQYEEEQNIINSGVNLDADLYVAGHHGSENASSAAFVAKMSPQTVFISCGKDNSYGHPQQGALNVFKNNGCDIYRSDVQGEVTCNSDGKTSWYSTTPCTDWTAGNADTSDGKEPVTTSAINQNQKNADTEENYVLNVRSHIFHKPSCASVKKMSSKNRKTVNAKMSDLIDQGYKPCQICNP